MKCRPKATGLALPERMAASADAPVKPPAWINTLRQYGRC